jgi:hypothetical protein
MNFARALIRDLVDKRLWPIAVVLVAALVAVPLLLSGGGDGAADDAPLAARAPADADAAKVAAVKLAGPPSGRSRPGDVRNPFRRPPVASTETTADAPAAAPAAEPADAPADAPAASGATGTTTTTTTPSTGTTTTTTTPSTAAGDADTEDAPVGGSYRRTEIRFGERLGASHAISRLTPVPGPGDPALIYLGVSAKGATFLLGSGTTATASGEGQCVDSHCRIIALKQGESMVVYATQGEGKARRLSLAVTSIDKIDASADYAKKMHARVHPDGREALTEMLGDRTAATAIGAIRYDTETGLLVPAASKAGSRADKVTG